MIPCSVSPETPVLRMFLPLLCCSRAVAVIEGLFHPSFVDFTSMMICLTQIAALVEVLSSRPEKHGGRPSERRSMLPIGTSVESFFNHAVSKLIRVEGIFVALWRLKIDPGLALLIHTCGAAPVVAVQISRGLWFCWSYGDA